MNNSMTFEEQTEQIVEALFTTLCLKKPREEVTDRCLELDYGNKIRFEVKKPREEVTDRCLELDYGNKIRFEGPKPVKLQGSRIAVDSASTFDPVAIAKLLTSIGDQYNAEMEGPINAVIAEESRKKIKKFGEVAESLSSIWISQNPELEPERAFLAVAVKLFVNFIKKTHGDRSQINILTETINRNPEVRSYIERQGGWGNLGRV
ncbi:bcl-2-like protein 15 [Thamnophis elegans]|uniref:bcl-2-like protein 15 n=1 Tax=Thamnophis elegans TaxID=35005 RepID=UPI0013776735|nr:bcl-2-like protein 15 [Thamnophis elegans]